MRRRVFRKGKEEVLMKAHCCYNCWLMPGPRETEKCSSTLSSRGMAISLHPHRQTDNCPTTAELSMRERQVREKQRCGQGSGHHAVGQSVPAAGAGMRRGLRRL